MKTAVELTKLEATSKTDQDQNFMSNEDITDEDQKENHE